MSNVGENLLRYLTLSVKIQSFSESAKPDLLNLRYDVNKKVVSCIYNCWKLIINEVARTEELYNLNKDFLERNNKIKVESEVYGKLYQLVKSHLLIEEFTKKQLLTSLK